jgi:GcrA cell cycle regulator
MSWTDERIERLRTLWTEGLSASSIAERLGYAARHTVLDKARSLGLAERKSATADWTDERTQRLRTLWAEGLSASCVAERLGSVSRSAVLGKVHRLGLARRKTAHRSNAAQVNGRAVTRATSNAAHIWRRAIAPAGPTLRLISSKAAPPPADRRAQETEAGALFLPFLALEAGMCRWPIGDPKGEDFGFCGQRQERGVSYCGRHAIAAFKPLKRRRA